MGQLMRVSLFFEYIVIKRLMLTRSIPCGQSHQSLHRRKNNDSFIYVNFCCQELILVVLDGIGQGDPNAIKFDILVLYLISSLEIITIHVLCVKFDHML